MGGFVMPKPRPILPETQGLIESLIRAQTAYVLDQINENADIAERANLDLQKHIRESYDIRPHPFLHPHPQPGDEVGPRVSQNSLTSPYTPRTVKGSPLAELREAANMVHRVCGEIEHADLGPIWRARALAAEERAEAAESLVGMMRGTFADLISQAQRAATLRPDP